ncbi:MAG TPA: CpsB/CapC family capsule biosynthesis tyrosine phosphatase [Polyangiaceae bacterium]|nr:CpsB/CapC family capsule biosynthesis tyrosine phosphatase [Polyangiaceae bacterium]
MCEVAPLLDLHCHFLPGIDDGAPTVADGVAMLEGLRALGFEQVVATPHMRPGMFDNEKQGLTDAFTRFLPHAAGRRVPELLLSSEHYFDERVYTRLLNGEALPYPGGRAALLEFYEIDFPPVIEQRLFDLRRRRILPVIAHPERYRKFWDAPEALERLVDQGVATLLDCMALTGKYGRRPQRAAEELLEREVYQAACTDLHRPGDLDTVRKAMALIEKRYGKDEIEFLFRTGPKALLEGRLPDV